LDILGELDCPQNGTRISTKDPNIFGWAFSKSNHEIEIVISVDGKVIRKANTGLARLDVDKKYPNCLKDPKIALDNGIPLPSQSCPYCGFKII